MSLTKLSELAVGDQKVAQSLQSLHGLRAILLGAILVNRGVRLFRLDGTETLSLPDELLEQLTFVLAQDQLARLINDIAQIPDQILTFFREVFGRVGQQLRLEGTIQGDVALLVRRQLAALEAYTFTTTTG